MQVTSITIPSGRIRIVRKAQRTPLSIFIDLVRALARKMAERRNRNALLELSDDQLKDIGLSRGQAGSDVHVYSRY
ncbi:MULTISPECIES: DUF1127 domain-containing protein [unclassified Rhizobium]|uniref:DUF1127 domain-containing protein n=1 Tax=unclassified Rhizobium TaxID=2613769 RepID=UPI000EA9F3C6|nr:MULTISPECIES: DUF1127 domain-containing protein [unclassified Rhizobium]AYG68883.1 DUF1127 domain-containing protein [Rhizobium sp. CCGE531]AYG75269.1 DUF1127 domain-containing protein [Rhizobium sp. CCGE532]